MNYKRQTEQKIVRNYIKTLLGNNFVLSVDDGEELHAKTHNIQTLIDQIYAVDEARVYAEKDDTLIGWIYFVLGNEPYEVVNDYTLSLENILKPAHKYAESFE